MHPARIQSHHPGLSTHLLNWMQLLPAHDWMESESEHRFDLEALFGRRVQDESVERLELMTESATQVRYLCNKLDFLVISE